MYCIAVAGRLRVGGVKTWRDVWGMVVLWLCQ